MVVILTSEVHDDTPAMYDIMCDDGLRTFILDHDILVWAGNVAESEAYAVSNALGVTRYPFIGVIVYNTLRGSQMTCVSKIEGLVTAADIVSCITDALDKYNPTLIALRADRREQTAAREIRAEQDSAYEQSLRRDRERAEQARLEREETERRAQAEAQKEQNVKSWRMWKAGTLQEPTEGRVARISFRMPDGSRVIRKFSADATIDDVHVWVDLHLNPVEGTAPSAPSNYTHEYDFTLAVPLPRNVLTPTNDPVSTNAKIFPSGSLIVEMID